MHSCIWTDIQKLEDLLAVKQQQGGIIQAQEAVRQADVAVRQTEVTLRQGRYIMVSTIMIIIFVSYFDGGICVS